MTDLTRRSVLGLAGAFGASRLLGCVHGAATQIEAVPAVQGFAWPPSARPGQTIELHVATTARWFVVELRALDGRSIAIDAPRFDGVAAPRGDYASAWAWPSYPIAIPRDLASGAYVATLRPCDRDGVPLDATPPALLGEANVLVVVRAEPERAGRVLYKLPLFTYHAYNTTGGGCLYGVWDRVGVTLRRPGGGTGHTERDGVRAVFPDGTLDPYGDASAPEWNTLATWDAKLLRWLAARGTAVDMCTDWDLHGDRELLAPYRLLISAGHDEYWSAEMRDRVEAFVAGGGNLAVFGGNTCFWRVEVDVAAGLVECNKVANQVGHWAAQLDDQQRPRFENRLTGMCMAAGGYTSQPRAPLGYTCTHGDLWPLAGVEPAFGEDHHLIGYEVDGAPVDETLALTYDFDTPSSFHALAVARLPGGDPSPDGWYTPASPRPGVAMIGMYNNVGTVVSTGTTDWPRVLAAGEPSVARITANVIDRLSTRSLDRRLVATLGTVRAAAAFGADGGHRVLVVASDGAIREVAWTAEGEPHTRALATVPGARAITSTGEGRALVATAAETIELAWSPESTVALASQRVLFTASAAMTMLAGDRAVLATAAGLVELAWIGATGESDVVTTPLVAIDGVVAVANVANNATIAQRAIAGTASGEVHALAWRDGEAVTASVVAQLGQPVVALAAYRDGEDRTIAIVAVADGNVYELAWRDDGQAERDVLPYGGRTEGTRPIASTVEAVAAYRDASGARHATLVVAGVVHQLRWRP